MAVSCIPFMFPGVAHVRCAFQLRHVEDAPSDFACAADPMAGGNISLSVGDDPARVVGNRAALAAWCGVDGMAELRQVHGDVTVFEPDPVPADTDAVREADGMATSRAGLGLMIKTADCQPLLLAHESGRFVAALHVGWRGNRMLYPQTGVQQFCAQYGLRPSEVLAVRGPSLGPTAAEFVHFATEWGSAFSPWFDPIHRTMDLWQLTQHQLQQAGLSPGHIFSLDLCTHTQHDRLFSYRRNPHGGRQGSVIWIERRQRKAEKS